MHKANMIMPVCSASPMLFYFYPKHLQIFPGRYKMRRFAYTKSVYFFITIKSIKREKERERRKLMRFTLRVMRNFKWRNVIAVCQCHFIKWIFFCCLLFNRIFYGERARQICKWGVGWEKMRKNKIKYNTQLQSVCFCVLSVLNSWELQRSYFLLLVLCRALSFPRKFRNIVSSM